MSSFANDLTAFSSIKPQPAGSSIALCAQCQSVPSKYTCPRCTLKTCSLTCSKLHKESSSCSGVRNPATFVPPNKYSYSSLVSDYTFLSSVGRKTDEVARDQAASALSEEAGKNSKRRMDVLKRELNKVGLGGIKFLPDGMEGRSINKTRWDPKTQTIQLTISLNDRSNSLPPTLLHSIPLQPRTTLLSLLPNSSPLQTPPLASNSTTVLASEPLPEPTHPSPSPPLSSSSPLSTTPLFLLPHPNNNPSQPQYYPPLSPTEPILSVLQHKSFIEWPRIELWDPTEWSRALEGEAVRVVLPLNDETSAQDERVETDSRCESGDGGRSGKRARFDDQVDSGWGARAGTRAATTLSVDEDPTKNILPCEEQTDKTIPPAVMDALVRDGLGLLGEYGSDDSDDEVDEAV